MALHSQSNCQPSVPGLQDIPNPEPDYFSIFDLKPQLQIDSDALQKKFYELSKKYHPDRYVAAGTREAGFALRWSTLVNKAYQTLRDDHLRSLYLLELYHVPEDKTSAVPLDLAETYFELQEALAENNREPLVRFKSELEAKTSHLRKEWQNLANQWPSTGSEIVLKKLQTLLNEQRYLKSMLADVEKKLA